MVEGSIRAPWIDAHVPRRPFHLPPVDDRPIVGKSLLADRLEMFLGPPSVGRDDEVGVRLVLEPRINPSRHLVPPVLRASGAHGPLPAIAHGTAESGGFLLPHCRPDGHGELVGEEVLRSTVLVEPPDQIRDRRLELRLLHDRRVESQPTKTGSNCLRCRWRHALEHLELHPVPPGPALRRVWRPRTARRGCD